MQWLTWKHTQSIASHVKEHLERMQDAMDTLLRISENDSEKWPVTAASSYLDILPRRWEEIRTVLRQMYPRLRSLASQEDTSLGIIQGIPASPIRVFVHTTLTATSIPEDKREHPVPAVYASDNMPGFMMELQSVVEDSTFQHMTIQFHQTTYSIQRIYSEQEGFQLLEEHIGKRQAENLAG